MGKSEVCACAKSSLFFPLRLWGRESFFGFCEKTSSFQNRERFLLRAIRASFSRFFSRLRTRIRTLTTLFSLFPYCFLSPSTKHANNNVRARRRKKKKKTRRRKRRGRKRRGKSDERGDRVRENLGVLLCVIFYLCSSQFSLRCYCFRENVKLTKSFLSLSLSFYEQRRDSN